MATVVFPVVQIVECNLIRERTQVGLAAATEDDPNKIRQAKLIRDNGMSQTGDRGDPGGRPHDAVPALEVKEVTGIKVSR
ncbi:hypothetical protein [Rhodococcus sp. B50]|uniref:hypothetical protein n=1 Tax=Rhodococcus sp. B50 TaxID=2682847 RepID=UPI0037EF6FB2|nr:hypothetical protein [Rhodococcus sp. B50]